MQNCRRQPLHFYLDTVYVRTHDKTTGGIESDHNTSLQADIDSTI